MEKKSLISTFKTAKKANVAKTDLNAKPASVTSKMSIHTLRAGGTNVGTKVAVASMRKVKSLRK